MNQPASRLDQREFPPKLPVINSWLPVWSMFIPSCRSHFKARAKRWKAWSVLPLQAVMDSLLCCLRRQETVGNCRIGFAAFSRQIVMWLCVSGADSAREGTAPGPRRGSSALIGSGFGSPRLPHNEHHEQTLEMA